MTKLLLTIVAAMILYDIALHVQGYLTDRAPTWWIPWWDSRATYDIFWGCYWAVALGLTGVIMWRL